MKYSDFKLVQSSPKQCYCFVCRDVVKAGDKRLTTSMGMPLCLTCMRAWEKEGGMLYRITRSKISDGFQIG